jgi:[histone H3]-lysine36 N-dimethyltransferase SETMAR
LNQINQINECNDECSCDENICSNRIVQRGCQHNLEIFKNESSAKGYCLRTKEFISCGEFVIEYAGEIIDAKQASKLRDERKQKGEKENFIMYIEEVYSDNTKNETIIDARHYSNVARFINHSCEPNLVLVPVRINNLLPHAALFALRDIQIDEELTYNYNTANKKDTSGCVCLCGSVQCVGYLP